MICYSVNATTEIIHDSKNLNVSTIGTNICEDFQNQQLLMVTNADYITDSCLAKATSSCDAAAMMLNFIPDSENL